MLRPRQYQLEMLEDSMRRNIIVAMDTGSGKTNIAVMRIREELERCPSDKRVWFLCPKVALAQQQHRVISTQLPAFPTKLLLGRDGCDFWSTQSLWQQVLLNIRIVVCTYDILSHALIHAFVQLRDIALLVFDEAHYCKLNHGANKIMQTFYHPSRLTAKEDVPCVLGLTASPVFNDGEKGLQIIERNLDAICRTPRVHREELLRYVHRPELILKIYKRGDLGASAVFKTLDGLFHNIDIIQDPFVRFLQASENFDPRQLEEAIQSRKTDSQEQLRAFVGTTRTVDAELGSWASAAYIRYCIDTFKQSKQGITGCSSSLKDDEVSYLSKFFTNIRSAFEFRREDLSITPKVSLLIDILLKEAGPDFSGIVFVDQRAVVCMLKRLLEAHPQTKALFRVGASVGTSSNTQRRTKIRDRIARDPDNEDIDEVLDHLRSGKKNLLISTTVVEEGIDITACNIVICFDQPKNLVSFIQRRGRARSSRSKYYVMMSNEEKKSTTDKWTDMEERMKEKYMDDMRELQRVENLEASSHGRREFIVPSTGAKLTLQDAVSHLWHFCNALPKVRYADTEPLFIRIGREVDEAVSCRVILPNCVDGSVREFESSRFWSSEKIAKMDAAFEAYVGLYNAGLINENLLPRATFVEEDKVYRKIEKRENVVIVNRCLNPWQDVAQAWSDKRSVQEFTITVLHGDVLQIQMQMLLPLVLTHVDPFKLYFDSETELLVSISHLKEVNYEDKSIELAHAFTKTVLYSAFRTRMSLERNGFPILFAPSYELDRGWIEQSQMNLEAKKILFQEYDAHALGLVRDTHAAPYIFQGLETAAEVPSDENDLSYTVRLKALRLPKRTNYLHSVTNEAQKKASVPVLLDPEQCTVDCLPASFARFATFIPSIMHKVRNALIVEDLCSTLLRPVAFFNSGLVLDAISAPMARESTDYQRLEFLGDALLKFYTAVSLTAEHPNYHEGYLSHLKDHIVSNGALAIAAKEKSLDRYILRNSFRGLKWRPLYNEDILAQEPPEKKELSTKVLADVVEALLGAAYLDGGEPRLLTCLQTLLPKNNWQPLSIRHKSILSAVSPLLTAVPPVIIRLESLTSHAFAHPSLALEALTHPSHLSSSLLSAIRTTSPPQRSILASIPSYQRLEFLGDAVLDQIVTHLIYSHQPALPVVRMHLLRTAAVNADFLAYRCLAHTIFVPTTDVVPPASPFGYSKNKKGREVKPEGTAAAPIPIMKEAAIEMSILSLLRCAPSLELSAALSSTKQRFEALKMRIGPALATGGTYPWTDLVALAPEKLISDLVESLLGAIYVDTAGNLEACARFLEEIGILPWLKRALSEGVAVWHPKEELGVLAARDQRRVEYVTAVDRNGKADAGAGFDKEVDGEDELEEICSGEYPASGDVNVGEGNIICRLKINNVEVSVARGVSRKAAETRAADLAIQKLKANNGLDAPIEQEMHGDNPIDLEQEQADNEMNGATPDEKSDVNSPSDLGTKMRKAFCWDATANGAVVGDNPAVGTEKGIFADDDCVPSHDAYNDQEASDGRMDDIERN